MGHFDDIDFSDFWDNSDYATRDSLPPPTDEEIAAVEKELGYKLPEAYIELMRNRNGGYPQKNCFPTSEPTGWADDHVQIEQILAIGFEGDYSLCGSLGSAFMQEEWEYPPYGIYFAFTPSAGHEMILLDYRKNGKDGEPEVVYVDQEADFETVFLAENFETFIRGLVPEDEFDIYDDAEDDDDIYDEDDDDDDDDIDDGDEFDEFDDEDDFEDLDEDGEGDKAK